jgi:hypothetical protein
MLKIHATGDWSAEQLRATLVPSTRRVVPEVEAVIEQGWCKGKARLGDKLFDGPMCRLEHFTSSPDALKLTLSLTSYRIFLGTNLNWAAIPSGYGSDVAANSVGMSSALLTSDGYLLFGRRNDRVAYYPNRVHPFAGSLEQRDLHDISSAIRREMHEELALTDGDLTSVRCLGIIEDLAIHQPEMIFSSRSTLTRARIESQVDEKEHEGIVAIEATRAAVEKVLADPKEFTPVGVGTLLLFGSSQFGSGWYERTSLSTVLRGEGGGEG